MRVRIAVSVLAISLAISPLAAAPAWAHGGRPQTQAIFFAPDDPDRIVAAATFGLLSSEDAGASWSWTCQESIPDAVPGVVQQGALAAGDVLLLAGAFGLVRGTRAGCAWERDATLEDRYISDVVRSPDGAILAVTGDSRDMIENHVFESVDDGASFAPIGAALPPRLLVERMRVAPSDPQRIYISGQSYIEGTVMLLGALVRSDDRGETWTEMPIDVVDLDRVVRLAAIDPVDPDVAWIVVQGSEHDRVLRASDGGRVVEEITTLLADPMPFFRPFGLAVASDGTVWFGNTREGLFAIPPGGTFVLVDKFLGVGCAAAHGDDVYFCADGLEDGFTIGRQRAGEAYALEPVAVFADIARRECASGVDCQCNDWWDDFQRETIPDGGVVAIDGGTCAPDGGSAPDAAIGLDAGTMDGGGDVDPPPSTCSCAVPGGRSGTSGPILCLCVIALAVARRSRPDA